jgi:hypothetical protein
LLDRPDTWAYDYDTNTWTNMQPAGDPPPGYNYFAMAYDAAADRVIVWRRGYNSSTKQIDSRIGVYDYNTNTWEQRSQALYPAAIYYNPMVYDPGTGLNIMFGGVDIYDTVLNETWAYDYATNRWTKIHANNPPSPRAWQAMVYDDQAGAIVMYGGGISRDEFTAETWEFDPASSTWSSLDSQP